MSNETKDLMEKLFIRQIENIEHFLRTRKDFCGNFNKAGYTCKSCPYETICNKSENFVNAIKMLNHLW